MKNERLKELIEKQREGKAHLPEYMIGCQLLDIAERERASAEILERDLEIEEMSLSAAAKKLKEYADKNHGKESCFCIPPQTAEKILREFYGLPEPSEKEAKSDGVDIVDVADFLL